MTPLTLTRFAPEHVPYAGRLLAARHRRDRLVLADLPNVFENEDKAGEAVAAGMEKPFAHGFSAFRGDRMVGYMVGALDLAEIWGRSGWVQPYGFAVAEDEDPETLRDLYAAVGDIWVRHGCFNHCVVVPTADPIIAQKFYSLAFGIEHVYALRNLRDTEIPEPEFGDCLTVRPVEEGDRDALAQMSRTIWNHQVGPPVWGVQLPEQVGEHENDYRDLVDEEDGIFYLGLVNSEPASLQGYYANPPSATELHIPDKCVALVAGGTVSGQRGKGIATAMTRYGLREARSAGADFCVTNWRSTNLLASRFWPRFGFKPVLYRLARRVDHRIAWGRGIVPGW